MKIYCFRVSGELSDRAITALSLDAADTLLKNEYGLTDFYGLREATNSEFLELAESGSFMN